MNNQSAAELEVEAEAARARVADTAESLRNKLTPGQMVDEFTGMMSGGDAETALRNLKAQVRDNPLPLALVGAGLAWLMLGQGNTGSTSARRDRERDDYPYHEEQLLPEGFADDGFGSQTTGTRRPSAGGGSVGQDDSSSVMDKLSGAVSSAAGIAGDAVAAATDSLSSAKHQAGRVGDKIGKLATGARRGLDRGSHKVASGGMQMRDATQDLIEREPLILAALGLAAGAALGALLPRTAVEDEHLGGYSRPLREAGEDMLEKGIEDVKEIASDAYAAVKDAADSQGLIPDSKGSLVDKVSEVVKETASKAEESLAKKLHPSS